MMKIYKIFLFVFVAFCIFNDSFAQNADEQGMYFSKKVYQPKPLPNYDETKNLLPSPIFDENPLWVETYWSAWEMAFKNFQAPADGSGFVSQFLDCAFNANIFLWDMSFQTMFLNVAHPLVPGISSLDNFYTKQHSSGEICREINRTTGVDFEPWRNTEDLPLFSRWGFDEYFNQYRSDVIYKGREAPSPNPKLTLDALNHPILAWAELESYKWTGDKERLKLVRLPLIKYYEALKKYIRQGNGLYITDWASMDNSPRNICLAKGGTGIDISSEMVLFARNLSELSAILGYEEEANKFNEEADILSAIINSKMWDEEKKFYFDLTIEEKFCGIKTIAAFWTLLSGTATPERAEYLVNQLKDPNTFGRLHPVPTLAADEDEFYPQGGYWSGAVWVMTNTMVIKGLDLFGYNELAKEIAIKHLDATAKVYKQTGTFWENYAADSIKEGINTNGAPVVKDIVGWGALAPVLYFIQYGIGLQPNAPKNELVWKIDSDKRCGCERFRFNGHIVDLVAEPTDNTIKITVQSDGEFLLKVICNGKEQKFNILKGNTVLSL
jgi:glycogen debranching enzyme